MVITRHTGDTGEVTRLLMDTRVLTMGRAWDPRFVPCSTSSSWRTSVRRRGVWSDELVLSQTFPMPLKFYACCVPREPWGGGVGDSQRHCAPPESDQKWSDSWPARLGPRHPIKCYRTADMCLFSCEPIISRCDLVIKIIVIINGKIYRLNRLKNSSIEI